MSAKNLLDNSSGGRPAIFSDLTGKVSYEPRLDLAASLDFLHEAHDVMVSADLKIEKFAVRSAITSICYHLGWHPYEISAAEQFIAQQGVITDLSAR